MTTKTTEILLKDNLAKYMNWLENFINNKNSFLTSTIYSHIDNPQDKEEIKNIKNLNNFFEIIYYYCKKNYIYSNTNKFGVYYTIEYHNIGYNIGYFKDQEPLTYFCMRTTLDDKKHIKFTDILANVQSQKIIQIKEALQQLANLIETLAEHNIQLEAINETTKNTLTKIRQKQLNKPTPNK